VRLDPQQEDVIRWKWTPDGRYSARSAYLLLHQGITTFPGADILWGCWAPLRVKLFLWLACRRRVWTADQRLRRGLEAHEICLLCDQEAEAVDHLLATCSVAKEIWWRTYSWARCVCTVAASASVHNWWEQLVTAQPQRRQQCTSTLFMASC
jgi:hypothetical protein